MTIQDCKVTSSDDGIRVPMVTITDVAIPKLRDALDRNEQIYNAAVNTLGRGGLEGRRDIETLLGLIRARSEVVRNRIRDAIDDLEDNAKVRAPE